MFKFILTISDKRINVSPLINNQSIDLIRYIDETLYNKLYIKLNYAGYAGYIYSPNNLFMLNCQNGYLEVAKWLIQTFDNIDVHAQDDLSFISSCRNGHLEVAKWLVQTFDNIDIHSENDQAFRYSCENGHLEVTKWLVQTFGNIDIHAKNDEAFRFSCKNGHLEVSKWLIEISDNNDEIIKYCYNTKKYDMMEYIVSYSPYYVLHKKDNQIVGYETIKYLNIKGSKR